MMYMKIEVNKTSSVVSSLEIDVPEEVFDEFVFLTKGKKYSYDLGGDSSFDFTLFWDGSTTLSCSDYNLTTNNENLKLIFETVHKNDFFPGTGMLEHGKFQERIDRFLETLYLILKTNEISYGSLMGGLREKYNATLC